MHCTRPRIFGTASPGAVRIAAALAACAALLAAAPAAQAQQKPIRFGALYIMSGSAAAYGQFAKQGLILGRQVEFALEDGQGKVDVAIQAARKLVFQGGADALMGLDSSGVANGLTPIVPELRKPFVITHAASPDVTGKLCNAYTYRVSVNVNQNMGAAAQIAAESGAKRWTTIGPDYAFGHQSWEYFGKYLKQRKPDVELMQEVAFPRFGAEDFVPFINSVMQSKPDGVLISLWGGDLVNFVRQGRTSASSSRNTRCCSRSARPSRCCRRSASRCRRACGRARATGSPRTTIRSTTPSSSRISIVSARRPATTRKEPTRRCICTRRRWRRRAAWTAQRWRRRSPECPSTRPTGA